MPVSRMKFVINIVFVSLLIGGTLFINGNGGEVKADNNGVYEKIQIFTEVLRQIEKNYVEPQEPKKLIYGAIKGMVQSLDPHSSFMSLPALPGTCQKISAYAVG